MSDNKRAESEFSAGRAKKQNIIRRLYAWTLGWAETRWAIPALFCISFVESSFFPIPPDPLSMALCFSKPKRWFHYAFWCTAGSVTGGMLGYYIGFAFWEAIGQPIISAYHGQEYFDIIKDCYQKAGFWAVFTAAFTFIPYKVFTIASGLFKMDFMTMVWASLAGRGLRFFGIALAIRLFGDRIRHILEKYLEIAAVLLILLGAAGFLALRWLL